MPSAKCDCVPFTLQRLQKVIVGCHAYFAGVCQTCAAGRHLALCKSAMARSEVRVELKPGSTQRAALAAAASPASLAKRASQKLMPVERQ